MADQKVSDLPALNGADVDSADLLYIIDSSAGTAGSKRITIGQFQVAPYSGGTANGVMYFNGSKVVTSGSSLTFDGTALSTTTVDTTNVEATNIKAKDGTSAASVADSTGVVSFTANPILSGGTANGVTYLNASKVLTSGSDLVFNATGLGIGTSSPKEKIDSRGAAVFSGDNATGTNAYGTASGILLSTSSDNTKARITAVSNGANSISLVLRSLSSGSAVDAVIVDPSGNLGLGVTPSASTSKTLQGTANVTFGSQGNGVNLASNAVDNSGWKYATTATASLYQHIGGAHYWYTAPSGTAGNAISWTQAMTLDASGRLLVGYTANVDGAALEINGNSVGATVYTARIANSSTSTSAYNAMRFAQGASGSATGIIGTGGSAVANTAFANNFAIGTQNSTNLAFITNDTERARITSGGDLLVGGTSVVLSSKFLSQFNGSTQNGAILNETASTSGTTFIAFSLSGTAIGSVTRVGATSAVAYNTTSDERLKSNIQDSAPVIEKLMAVKVRQYDWTDGDLHQEYGFIAQELEPVLSGVVTKGKTEDDMWQLDYSKLTPHLLKAIQEQQALITDLRARVAALENQP